MITTDLSQRGSRVRAICTTLGVTLIIIALAGPRWGFRWEEVEREGIDLIVALDTSRSMLARDVKPTRIARAKLAIQDLVEQMGGDRVALVPFAGLAFVQCPLTLDYQAFRESLRATRVGIIPRGGTALAAAIDTSLEGAEGHQGKHLAVVLITDGENHEGDLDESLARAKERGVRIYTVGIGTVSGELINVEEGGQESFLKDRKGQVVKSRLDESTLERIASETGGAYVRAQGADLGLGQLYEEYISKLDKRSLKSSMEKRYKEYFQLPLFLAFLLLAGEQITDVFRSRRWLKRIPWLGRNRRGD